MGILSLSFRGCNCLPAAIALRFHTKVLEFWSLTRTIWLKVTEDIEGSSESGEDGESRCESFFRNICSTACVVGKAVLFYHKLEQARFCRPCLSGVSVTSSQRYSSGT